MKLFKDISTVLRAARTRRPLSYSYREQPLASRVYCEDDRNVYSISTPIFYVNAAPHIGHLHSLVVADAINLFKRLTTARESIFSTGTDEHGMKVQKAATLLGRDPKKFCDEYSFKFRRLCDVYHLSYNEFIRTTDYGHRCAVQFFWDTLTENGLLYKSNYEGWYCVSDETFVPPLQIEEIQLNGKPVKVSTESGNPVEWVREENYMFRMSQFQEPLLFWLRKNPTAIQPQKFQDLVLHMLSQPLPDLSVSRPASRLSWGIPVPGDLDHTIYVWLDALVNYLTVGGYPGPICKWPIDCHVIGKDILKFHAVYWPALLLGAQMPMPKKILCHSHWTVDDTKMSKSKGNVIDPFKLMETYHYESIRYYLLREGVPHQDGAFSELQLSRFTNSELADTYGNLISRCCAKSINKCQVIPETPSPELLASSQIGELRGLLKNLPEEVAFHYESANFYRGIEAIMKCLREANLFVQNEKPWLLAKQPDQAERLNFCIFVALETCRICSILLQPIVPEAAGIALAKLNVPRDQRYFPFADDQFAQAPERPLGDGTSVVTRKIRVTNTASK